MFKGLQPILYGGREVWPLIEGGKGVSATNHASSGAWAAAGGVNLDTIRAIATSGVDFISVGRITQSAPAVDIGLDYAVQELPG